MRRTASESPACARDRASASAKIPRASITRSDRTAPLHGPYWQWTRKVAGKTITRLISDEQLDDYRQWLDNDRKLRALVAELEALTLTIADADPRGKRRPARPARGTRQTTT